MELKAERVLPTLLLTSSLLLGSVACNHESNSDNTEKHNKQTQTTIPENDVTEDGDIPKDLPEAIRSVEFFATPLEFAALTKDYTQEPPDIGQDSVALLANRGISVSGSYSNFNGSEGVLVGSVKMLAVLPCRLIEASELKHITFVKSPEFTTIEQSQRDDANNAEPRIKKDSVEVEHSYQLSRAIAALILNNVPESQDVIERFKKITKEAGAQYNPDFKVRFEIGEDGLTLSNPDFTDDFMYIFDSQESVTSARIEFINMFNDYIFSIESDYVHKPDTPRGQKQALLRDLYNQIVGDGGTTLAFNGVLGQYGTHGLHPLDNIERIRRIEADLSKTTSKVEEKQILLDDFEHRRYDPSYPLDLKIKKNTVPVPCKSADTVDSTESLA